MTKMTNEQKVLIEEQRKKGKPVIYQHTIIMHKGLIKRMTVCGFINENEMHIGISICSPLDQFSRPKGRSKSRLKAHQRPYETISIVEGVTPNKQLYNWIKESFETITYVNDELVFQKTGKSVMKQIAEVSQ